jgi:hypothetical protein
VTPIAVRVLVVAAGLLLVVAATWMQHATVASVHRLTGRPAQDVLTQLGSPAEVVSVPTIDGGTTEEWVYPLREGGTARVEITNGRVRKVSVVKQ